MWVVKLGGSLGWNAGLRDWLWNLAEYGQGRVVIVPGGGRFADQVRLAQRHWGIDDRTAHRMALLAMHQYALLCVGLEPRLALARTGKIRPALGRGRVVLWLPGVVELDRAGIPSSWAVTSDSLAAWLAGRLRAERLVLVKAKVPAGNDPATLREDGTVDAGFPDWLPPGIRLDCLHLGRLGRFVRELRTHPRVAGVRPG